ncbi:MAG: aspartate-semialdehyde dehydrogenase [Alphaproteobacteria bacterium]
MSLDDAELPARADATAETATVAAAAVKRAGKPAPSVAIVGATGAVGRELIGCLERRRFPVGDLRLFASARSAGRPLSFAGRRIEVETLTETGFAGVDIALFSAGSGTSRTYGPIAAAAGAVVVDNSSAFRMDAGVPLVVPEVNPEAIARHKGIIANPNCVAIVAVVPLWPLHRQNRIRRLTMATYQAASGAGAAAMEELRASTAAHLRGADYRPTVLAHPYAFNLFSHDSAVDPATGFNGEETKVMAETRKIMGDDDIRIAITCIRVPVLRAHSIAMTIELDRPMAPEEARAILAGAPGVRLVDDVANNRFPMPVEATGIDEVLVGRIRRDPGDPSGRSLMLFVAGDQLLKGAALNAIQIAERLPAAGRA